MKDLPRRNQSYWRLVEPVWRSVSIYDGSEVFLDQFRKLRPEVGHLFAAHWCQSEVLNGGLHQFFANSTGVLAPEAVEGFGAIGLHEWTNILTEAMALFGTPYPRDREDRQQLLPGVQGRRQKRDPFSALDERFFDWLQDEPDGWEHAADTYAGRFRGAEPADG
jgi:hypothetical protein